MVVEPVLWSDTKQPLTGPDDPRLDGWYHTIELGDGVVTRAMFDHRPVVDRYGLPESLKGKTALDVGTCDGFWAFEMERRGAERVVATDIGRWAEFDWLPRTREAKSHRANERPADRFWFAHAMRGSRVEYEVCNVYDLSPERIGTFDVVFCGSLLLHLQNPIKALLKIRSVTKEMAIIATRAEAKLYEQFPNEPWIAFGHRSKEGTPGEANIYWRFSPRALQKMMEYAGFGATEPLEPFVMSPRRRHEITVVIGRLGAEAPDNA
jgi:tRNA (mo5U34)-methyltransferase